MQPQADQSELVTIVTFPMCSPMLLPELQGANRGDVLTEAGLRDGAC